MGNTSIKASMAESFSEIVKRAMVETITNIGQLSADEKRELERAVRKGWLSKGKGGAFPMPKTVYAHPGFDFAADRRFYYRQFLLDSGIDSSRRAVSR